MNFTTKLIVSLITISASVFGVVYTAFEKNDGRMEEKVKESEKRTFKLIKSMDKTRDAEVTGIKKEFTAEISGLKTQLSSIDGKLNILIRRSAQTSPDEEDEELYSNYKESSEEEPTSF